MPTFNFTTGPSTLPDVGTLEYNGCKFSPLFATEVQGNAIKDEANRTVKFMEYNIKVDGYVTLPDNDDNIHMTTLNMRKLLSAQGGTLIYTGRGMDLVVNGAAGATTHDVAWGPAPEILEYQPLGAGRSAKVVWRVKVRISEQVRGPQQLPKQDKDDGIKFGPFGVILPNKKKVARGGIALPMLQFNYETSVSYTEDGYSSIDVKGVVEIPLTRIPGQQTRTLQSTADDIRDEIDKRIVTGIDLTKFRIASRNFNLSRDKRTLEWNIRAEEKPYMDLPIGCTMARGSYTVRPSQQGMGLAKWLCSLNATYTVRADSPRRVAWLCFLALLRYRMECANETKLVDVFDRPEPPKKLNNPTATTILDTLFQINRNVERISKGKRQAWIIDFNINEGLYADSKTTTFSATWMLIANFSHILIDSGLWKKVPEKDAKDKNLWATFMGDISGSESWLPNKVDPSRDIIVDFGS